MTKWIGAAAWSAKEARAGDRLPYARLVDEHTVLLRDGALMVSLQAMRQAMRVSMVVFSWRRMMLPASITSLWLR